MKNYLVLLIFITTQGYSQSFVQFKDGRKSMIVEHSFKVQPKNKLITFTQNDSTVVKLKYKDLDSAVIGNFRFKVSEIDKKIRGNYELAVSSTKKLLAISSVISRPAGGFERLYTSYDLYITLKSTNEVVYKNSFSNENTNTEISRRIDILKVIKDNFEDCPKVLNRISAIEAAVTNTDRVIEEFIKVPVYTLCD